MEDFARKNGWDGKCAKTHPPPTPPTPQRECQLKYYSIEERPELYCCKWISGNLGKLENPWKSYYRTRNPEWYPCPSCYPEFWKSKMLSETITEHETKIAYNVLPLPLDQNYLIKKHKYNNYDLKTISSFIILYRYLNNLSNSIVEKEVINYNENKKLKEKINIMEKEIKILNEKNIEMKEKFNKINQEMEEKFNKINQEMEYIFNKNELYNKQSNELSNFLDELD